MRITCDICVDSVSRDYTDWLNHLTSIEHQSKVNEVFQTWQEEANERSLVIMDYPREGLDILHNVLESFADYGMISDFMLHEHEKFFIVQYGNMLVYLISTNYTYHFCCITSKRIIMNIFYITFHFHSGGLQNFMKYRCSTPDNDLMVIKNKLEISAETCKLATIKLCLILFISLLNDVDATNKSILNSFRDQPDSSKPLLGITTDRIPEGNDTD